MPDPIIELFAGVLGVEPRELNEATCPANTPTWDSMANIMLITEIEAQFGVELSTSDIESMKSVGEVRTVLSRLGVTSAAADQT